MNTLEMIAPETGAVDENDVPALQQQAREDLERGSLGGAARNYYRILQKEENNVDATLGLGLVFLKQGRSDMARKSFERVLKLQPNHPLATQILNPPKKTHRLPPILVRTHNYDSCSAGVRVMHYLAALLHSVNVPVAVTSPCFFNPTIPVRPQALPDDIVVYPDACPGNGNGARRVCRYMLYHAEAYFGGGQITKEECAIVYLRDYLAGVQAHCYHLVTEDDIITIPILDAQWCFPEAKTIENVLYVGKGAGKPLPKIDYMLVPAANAPQNRGSAYADHYAHMRTLAMLRKAKNFYTLDAKTLMSCEAALCGCKVFVVQDADTLEEQTNIIEEAQKHVMCPDRDMDLARRFADNVYRFFKIY
jgi:tetratricopeptide (TPR) repeat protein